MEPEEVIDPPQARVQCKACGNPLKYTGRVWLHKGFGFDHPAEPEQTYEEAN